LQAGVDGSWPRVPVTVQEVASVHHRSRLSVTPWKTQCAQSVLLTAGCSSMERQSIDRAWKKRCAGLGACSGQCGAWSDRHVPCRGRWFVPASPRRAYAGSLSVYQADPMGPFRVKGTAAPEVKFLDRCKTRGSEGVLQGRVRRSRMRVWGAKMIRHRRSPAL